jgi:hypothetical protein
LRHAWQTINLADTPRHSRAKTLIAIISALKLKDAFHIAASNEPPTAIADYIIYIANEQ